MWLVFLILNISFIKLGFKLLNVLHVLRNFSRSKFILFYGFSSSYCSNEHSLSFTLELICVDFHFYLVIKQTVVKVLACKTGNQNLSLT